MQNGLGRLPRFGCRRSFHRTVNDVDGIGLANGGDARGWDDVCLMLCEAPADAGLIYVVSSDFSKAASLLQITVSVGGRTDE